MSKIKQSPKLPAEERKKQLLDSAGKLFAQKGYKETTVEEIARNAKLTKGALYYHFKSKEDILFELIKVVMSAGTCEVDKQKNKLTKPSDYLKLFLIHDKFDFNFEELCWNLDFWVQAMSIPRIKRYMNKAYCDMVEQFIETVDPVYGRTAKERKTIAMFTFALIDGLVVRHVMNPKGVDVKSLIKLYDNLFKALIENKSKGKN